MRSKRSTEGYILIDNSEARGFPEGFGRGIVDPQTLVPGGKKVEAALLTCSHCQKSTMKNPKRVKPRGYCPGCHHYVCDWCDGMRKVTGCTSFLNLVKRLQEQAGRDLNLKEI